MPTVVGLAFEPAGTIHYFSPAHITLAEGDAVVADTAAGPRVAQVVIPPRQIGQDRLPTAVRTVLRIASPEDVARNDANTRLEQKARSIVPETIQRLDLSMKIIDVDADWDTTRITVFFAAEGRVDFRELVRVLASELGVRVQMHQLGARDHAKMIGGLASCGRETCCSSWMPSFEPVSMRMAKEQNLFLNPSKFSGNCGKLKCCLRYEYELYCDGDETAPAPTGTRNISESA